MGLICWRVKMSKFLLLTASAFGLLFSSALAQEKSLDEHDRESNRIWGAEGLQRLQFARTVPSGANQRIEFITALNPDCTSSGDVDVRVTKQPEHGKLDMRWLRLSEQNFRVDKWSLCRG